LRAPPPATIQLRGGFGSSGTATGAKGPDAPSDDFAPRRTRPAADDPLADAEAALKKLRRQPDDKDAADALEDALKRLKARANKPDREVK